MTTGVLSSRSEGVTEITARGRASRERIVQAALTLMREQGVSATSVDDVIERAGASKSQMYHYFSGKADLVDAVVEAAASMVLNGQQPALGAIDSWDSLVAWTDHVVALNATHGVDLGCPLGTLAAELGAARVSSREQIDRHFQEWTGQIRDGLTTMQTRGFLRKSADPELLALALISSLQGGLLLAKTTRSVRPIRVALDSALAYVGTFRKQ